MAQTIVQQQAEQQAHQKSVFEGLFESIEKITPELGGMDEISVLLTLPDEQFIILAPIFLDELEKGLNNIDDKLFIAQAVNASGAKLEDIAKAYSELIAKIDEEMSEILSSPKRDFLKRMLSISYNSLAETEGITKRIVQVPIELTSEDAQIPKYAHLGDGAVDLYSPADYIIKPGETIIIPLDIKIALPYGYAFLIHPRSGTSAKSKLRIANSIGLVDSQYKGVIGVIVENIEPPIKDITYEFDKKGRPILTSVLHGQSYTISKGERFAQMRLVEVPTANFFQVESVDGIGDDRGGGFGSSGTN
jgi:dUTP pyrophosphatase